MKTRVFSFGVLPVLAALLLFGCGHNVGGLTRAEEALINGSDSLMRVLTIRDTTDMAVLRAESVDFTALLVDDSLQRVGTFIGGVELLLVAGT